MTEGHGKKRWSIQRFGFPHTLFSKPAALSYSWRDRVGKILLTIKSFFRGLWNRVEKMMPQQLPASPSLCNLALKIFKKVSQRKREFQLKSYLFAIEIGVSPEGRSRAGEGKHWQRHWNGDIHAHLKRTNAHQVLITAQPTECPCRSTKATEINFIFLFGF